MSSAFWTSNLTLHDCSLSAPTTPGVYASITYTSAGKGNALETVSPAGPPYTPSAGCIFANNPATSTGRTWPYVYRCHPGPAQTWTIDTACSPMPPACASRLKPDLPGLQRDWLRASNVRASLFDHVYEVLPCR